MCVVRLLPDPALDWLGVIAAEQALWLGEPAAHVAAFYRARLGMKERR